MSIGKDLQLPHRPDLSSRLSRNRILYGFDQLRGRKQRIAPIRHGGRPGVIGESADLRLVFVNADDSFDYANGNLAFVERAALLDVQFQIATKGMRGEPRLR